MTSTSAAALARSARGEVGRIRGRIWVGMYRLALVLSCLLSANCTVVTSILATDLDEPTADAAPSGTADGGGEVPDGAALVCPGAYAQVAGTCHRLSLQTRKWLDAELDCENDGPGSHLVIVDDMAEQVALATEVWIGLYEFNVDGAFRTVTDVDPPFLNWAGANPGLGGGLCVDSRSDGLHDDDCNKLKQYVCEYDGVSAAPLPDIF